jgi:RNA polymerase sigma-70 factor (ECF subfamily)
MTVVMEATPDRELWARATAGDPAAFGTLFERHGQTVYNYCFRRTAEWATAEDLTSVVFLESWRRRRHVRMHGESVLPWLLGVAANVVRNRNRGLRRYRAALERLPFESTADFAADVDGRLDDERRMGRVLGALERLPGPDQDILTLCIWSDLTYEQAAVALDLPVGTVRSRLSRARRRLQAELDEPDEEGCVPMERKALA